MEKRILLVASGLTGEMIATSLRKANLTIDDFTIIQEDSDEAKELLKSNRHQFAELVPKPFEIKPHRIDLDKYARDMTQTFNRKTKGGKKNKKNWKY